ncbi:hypothetical protein BCR44DRAFT_1179067 [Catenaria anguillulae PL171]|uniref:Dynamin-type G domain-containing protein n=1 Tax=Catenaria anguillulae PL171 TaxID=765915 RepID=A0A1Y2HI45_9FUNG|nr:hypothetical protein BCR44DRAFT_1179067 [Catenaria anguillulae PL171]
MSFYSTSSNAADAEVPAFSPLAGPSAAQEQYQANQLRLVGFIHQTRHLLSQVDRLAHPDKPVRLSYPTATSATASHLKEPAIPENDNDANDDVSEDVEDCRSEFGTAATRRRAGTGTGSPRPNGSRHTRSSSSSSSASSSPVPPATAPGLFKVLTLDVPTSPRTGTILLPSDALSGMLRTKLADLKTHLGTLESRVQDRTSRILVTGDLNAGKSTFVNALLRRSVVPTDQQPLTNVFTEVVDAKHNRKHPGREEVHAVVDPSDPHGTVDVLPIEALERLVAEPEPYGMIKVFVREEAEHPAAQGPGSPTIRASESSLSLAAAAVAAHNQQEQEQQQQQAAHLLDDDVNSSVLVGSADVDVRLIDSPGLNRDVWKTMSIFSQQAEIDVIVFVVSAENHFTLSSREFLAKAGQEKAYIFVVVNKFDSIRDKDRCAKVILQQIEQLSPHTHALQDKLVHFVSAEAMLLEASQLGRYSRGELDVLQFLHVERALKEFTLEKRAVSKLHPAKRFLESLLVDVEVLVEYNVRKAQEQVAGIRGELAQLRPLEQELDAHRAQTLRALEKELGVAANKASDAVQTQLAAGKLADRLTKRALGVEWRGVRHALAYVRDVHAALVAALAEDVNVAQDVAEAAMREAWQNMDKMHQGWVGKVAAAAALDAEPSVPLAPLQVTGTSLIKLYPITSGIGAQQGGLVLTPRSLLFPHMPSAPALHVPVLLSRQALANPQQALLDTWMHLTSRIGSLSWSDVTPLAIVDKLGGTATASSLALTGCSFLTSSVLATRSVGGDIMTLGMRVGLKRVAIITLVGVATVGSLSAYHWLVTLPSHLPESMARAALEQVHAAQYPQTLAAHLSTTARVALTRTVAEAQTKMDHGLAKVKSQQEKLAHKVELVEAAVEEMEAVKQRAELVRVQVAAVAVEDRIVGKLAPHMPRVRA